MFAGVDFFRCKLRACVNPSHIRRYSSLGLPKYLYNLVTLNSQRFVSWCSPNEWKAPPAYSDLVAGLQISLRATKYISSDIGGDDKFEC